MPDELNVAPPGDPEQPYYTETVVEYVDNRRQRAILGIILVLAFLALIGLSYSVLRLSKGASSPAQGAMPTGIEWVRSIYGWGNGADEVLLAPTDVDIARDGTIWVVSGHDTISAYNPDGTVKRVIKPKGTASIETIAVADNGDLYVADFGGQVLQFDPNGKLLDQWKVQLAQGIDVTDGSKIAVSSTGGVAVFTPEGRIVAKWGSRGQGDDQFDLPHAIMFGPDGSLYVADTQNKRVRKFTANGREVWTNGTAPDRSKPGAADFRDPKNTKGLWAIPSGMAMNGKGQIVVVDPFKFTITVLDAKTGKLVKLTGRNGKPGRSAIFGDYGQADGFFAYPTGIAYDRTRDWFAVADTANNRVQILRLPESGGNPASRAIGAFRLPMCIFCLPLLLLLLAVIVLVSRRRREQAAEPPADGEAVLEG